VLFEAFFKASAVYEKGLRLLATDYL